MIDRSHALPVTRQARELGISCGSVYYLPRPTSPTDLLIKADLQGGGLCRHKPSLVHDVIAGPSTERRTGN